MERGLNGFDLFNLFKLETYIFWGAEFNEFLYKNEKAQSKFSVYKIDHNGTSSNSENGFNRYSSIDSRTQSDETKFIPNCRH